MKKQTVDRILGISALLLSFLTLIMFIYQTKVIHKQSRLSVFPRIGFHVKNEVKDTTIVYSIELINKGIGPAIINSSKIVSGEKEYELDMYKYFNLEYPNLKKLGTFNTLSSISDGTTLSSNETLILFSFEFTKEKQEKILTYLGIKQLDEIPIDLKIVYSSVYEEKWEVKLKNNEAPKKLK